ncbi:Hypothetical protein A7982_11247 [Minicystis rosea]|nr:Hypothetical protein A7982_11247 [Minicystis rosea]
MSRAPKGSRSRRQRSRIAAVSVTIPVLAVRAVARPNPEDRHHRISPERC